MLPSERRVDRSLKGVVVGEIISIRKHPNADLLRIARVFLGKNTYKKIIFGGPKIEYIGAKVAVALIGTATDDGKLKKRRYRGQISKGMICAAVELGIVVKGPDAIMILSENTIVGTPLKSISKQIYNAKLPKVHTQKICTCYN